MLSAVIPSKRSYPAVLLAEQLVHQRFVLSGPLVTYSPISRSADYIFTPDSIGGPTYYSDIFPNSINHYLVANEATKSLRGQASTTHWNYQLSISSFQTNPNFLNCELPCVSEYGQQQGVLAAIP